MDLLKREFTAKEIAQATGINVRLISDWATRGLIVGQSGGGIQGKNRKFSFFNVMEIAVANATIQQFKFLPGQAFKVAARFAHTGGSPSGYSGSDVARQGADRFPGFPFYDGRTLLCVAGDRSAIIQWNPRAQPKPKTDILDEIRNSLGQPLAFMIVDVGDIFDRVTASLGFHPQQVIVEAYGIV